jgi:glycosyltransferase involved in cell wall biosynthesis
MNPTYTLHPADGSIGKPLVSILIPAYNAEKWITDAIRSALAQTWNPKEIIVVNDGSNDRTLEVASQFGQELVLVISQEHQGAAAARNNAFKHCHGDYIQWLDADDLLAPEKIAKQMKAVCECTDNRTLFSSPWGPFFYRPERAKFTPSALWCDLSSSEFLIRKMGLSLFMQTSTWLVSRELSEAAGPWNTDLASDDDGEYFCRVLLASNGIRFVPEARVYYRSVGIHSLSRDLRSDRKLEALWRSMQSHIRCLRSLEDSERSRAACLTYMQDTMSHFYPRRLDIVAQMKQVAEDLGGQLQVPRLSWKYAWIKSLFGWGFAQRAQLFLPHLKWEVARHWDRMLLRLEGGTLLGHLGHNTNAR